MSHTINRGLPLNIKNMIFRGCLLVIVVLSAYVNYINIIEAFGSGPPYYSRTTNMDKWQNPTIFLVTFNLVSVLIIYFVYQMTVQGKKKIE